MVSDQNNSKDDSKGRLSMRRPLKFISDSESNTIVVQNADAAQLKTIEELIALYDKPPRRFPIGPEKRKLFISNIPRPRL